MAEDLSNFIKCSEVLEYLDLSSCGLREKASECVIDGIMKNESIKYLMMGGNSFSSRSYLLAAKLGRMLQGHKELLHVNLEECELVSEELVYLCMCIRDSKNIQGIHLTGNKFTYYDRRLMRALFPARVNWPLPPSTVQKFEKISATDKVTLVNLNSMFLMQLPPEYVPEVGMSSVLSAEDMQRKIQSYEKWKDIDENTKKPDKVRDDKDLLKKLGENFKKLVGDRLAEVEQESQHHGASLPPTRTIARRGQLDTENSQSARSGDKH